MNTVLIIAGYEFYLLIKNRWLLGFTVIFALLSISLVFVLAGAYQDWLAGGFDRISATISNFVIVLSSLMGILFSSLSFVGDRSDKFADLLASYPIKTHQYVFGKYLGLLLAMALSLFVGFAPVLISSVIISGKAYLQGILITLLSGILLSAMYAAWGALIGCLVQSRLNALAAALIMWFFSVFIYELLLWAFLPHLPFFMQKTSIAVLLSINPAQVVRIGAVFVQGDGVVFGADFYSWQLFFRSITGGIVGSLLIIAHLLFPIVLSILLTRNKK